LRRQIFFLHTCRKHKLYEQYILYYCTHVLVEIVFFILYYFVMNPADRGPEKERKLCMSKLIEHEEAIQNLSYKYTLFQPAQRFYLYYFNYTCCREQCVFVWMMEQHRADTIKLHAEFMLTSVTRLRATTSGNKRLLVLGLKRFNLYFNMRK
jgi:hypothetical protein